MRKPAATLVHGTGGKPENIGIDPRSVAIATALCGDFGHSPRPMPLSRIAWLCTVAACLITAVLLLISDYKGYAALALAVGISASINLR